MMQQDGGLLYVPQLQDTALVPSFSKLSPSLTFIAETLLGEGYSKRHRKVCSNSNTDSSSDC